MLFEIQLMEGLGRLGKLNMTSMFETPSLLSLQYRYSDHISLSLKENFPSKLVKELPFLSLTYLNKSSYSSSHDGLRTEALPTCYLYSSLQIQGKTKSQLKRFIDLFPKKYHSSLLSNDSIHLIPWDLPEIILDHFSDYLDTITSLSLNEPNISSNFMINIPFSNNLMNSLPQLKSPAIGVVCLGDISSLINHSEFLLDYITILKEKVSLCVYFMPLVCPPSIFQFFHT